MRNAFLLSLPRWLTMEISKSFKAAIVNVQIADLDLVISKPLCFAEINRNVIYWTIINLWVEHKPKGFKINSLLIEFTLIISSCLVMCGLRCPMLFLQDSALWDGNFLGGKEGTMNVPHSGNNVPCLLYKHLLYIIVIDMLFVYFTGVFMIAYLVCFYVFIVYEM